MLSRRSCPRVALACWSTACATPSPTKGPDALVQGRGVLGALAQGRGVQGRGVLDVPAQGRGLDAVALAHDRWILGALALGPGVLGAPARGRGADALALAPAQGILGALARGPGPGRGMLGGQATRRPKLQASRSPSPRRHRHPAIAIVAATVTEIGTEIGTANVTRIIIVIATATGTVADRTHTMKKCIPIVMPKRANLPHCTVPYRIVSYISGQSDDDYRMGGG